VVGGGEAIEVLPKGVDLVWGNITGRTYGDAGWNTMPTASHATVYDDTPDLSLTIYKNINGAFTAVDSIDGAGTYKVTAKTNDNNYALNGAVDGYVTSETFTVDPAEVTIEWTNVHDRTFGCVGWDAEPVATYTLGGVEYTPEVKLLCNDYVIKLEPQKAICGDCKAVAQVEDTENITFNNKEAYFTIAKLGIGVTLKNFKSVGDTFELEKEYGANFPVFEAEYTLTNGGVLAEGMDELIQNTLNAEGTFYRVSGVERVGEKYSLLVKKTNNCLVNTSMTYAQHYIRIIPKKVDAVWANADDRDKGTNGWNAMPTASYKDLNGWHTNLSVKLYKLVGGTETEVTSIDNGGVYKATAMCTDGDYALNGADANGYITKSFTITIVYYDVCLTQDVTGGTVGADKARAEEGETVTLTNTPATGYEFVSYTVTCGETAVEVSGDNTFTMPAGSVSVTAEFRKIDYTITVTEPENGTVTAPATANYGDTVTVTVTPATGFETDKITVMCGTTSITVGEGNTFTMPAGNVTVTAALKEKDYYVDNDILYVNATLTALPTDVADYNKIHVNPTGKLALADAAYSDPVHNEGTIASGIFTGAVLNENTITGGTFGGEMTNAGSVENAKFVSGASVTEQGGVITSVIHSVNGEDEVLKYDENLLLELNGITPASVWISGDSAVGENDAVPYIYTGYKSVHTITVTEPENGTVTAPATANYGDAVTLTATPATGFVVDKITVMCGATSVTVGEGNTFTMPAGNVTVTATFKQIVYTVSFDMNGGTGEEIEPVPVIANSPYPLPECGFTAPGGFEFKAWNVNGTEYQPGATIVVNGDTLVKAVWKEIPVSTATPTPAPTATPTVAPTARPTPAPTATTTVTPTARPTPAPAATPTVAPTARPTPAPAATPTVAPTATPTPASTETPTPASTETPTAAPTETPAPTATSAVATTATPTPASTESPMAAPTRKPVETIGVAVYDEYIGTGGGEAELSIVFDADYLPQDYTIIPEKRNAGEDQPHEHSEIHEQDHMMIVQVYAEEGEIVAQHSMILSLAQMERLHREHEMDAIVFENGGMTAGITVEEIMTGDVAKLMSRLLDGEDIQPDQLADLDFDSQPEPEFTDAQLSQMNIEVRIVPEEMDDGSVAYEVGVFLRYNDQEMAIAEMLPAFMVYLRVEEELLTEEDRADYAAKHIVVYTAEDGTETILQSTLMRIPQEMPDEHDTADRHSMSFDEETTVQVEETMTLEDYRWDALAVSYAGNGQYAVREITGK